MIQQTGPALYKVMNVAGQLLRRHVDQLRARYTPEDIVPDQPLEDLGPSSPAASSDVQESTEDNSTIAQAGSVEIPQPTHFDVQPGTEDLLIVMFPWSHLKGGGM